MCLFCWTWKSSKKGKRITVFKHPEQSERYRSASGVLFFTASASQSGKRRSKRTLYVRRYCMKRGINFHLAFAFSLILLLLGATKAIAAPTYFEGTGHYYEMVCPSETITWDTAKANAEAAGGYLATITSQEENNFCLTLFDPGRDWSGIGSAYIGGHAVNGDINNWAWVTGETWGYANWSWGEPNNPDSEFCLALVSPYYPWHTNEWINLSGDGVASPYIVEYVPEPATLSLLVLGGLAMMRRRKA
jgi:hypothetical protein